MDHSLSAAGKDNEHYWSASLVDGASYIIRGADVSRSAQLTVSGNLVVLVDTVRYARLVNVWIGLSYPDKLHFNL